MAYGDPTWSEERNRSPENWALMTGVMLVCSFLGYTVYTAVIATASELLQRLIVISPLVLMVVVHWLSASHIPTRGGGSPVGIVFLVAALIIFLLSHQPSPIICTLLCVVLFKWL